MNIIAEIFRTPDVNILGTTIHRIAVRAVINHGGRLLMVYSETVGDYKFPGGGVGLGESHESALAREVREECGTNLIKFGPEIGITVEYGRALEPDVDVFKMTSHYYLCEIGSDFGPQQLEEYEENLGFKPVWVNIEDAIMENNKIAMRSEKPAWLNREIKVLEYLKRMD